MIKWKHPVRQGVFHMNPQNDQRTDPIKPPEREGINDANQREAANVIRGDIDRIFNNGGSPTAEAEESIKQEYAKELSKETKKESGNSDVHIAQDNIDGHWKQYHSSWQSYYKQYYERYYLNHVHSLKTADTPDPTPNEKLEDNDEAVNELRDKLLKTVQDQATTVRKSRHFAPIATAVLVALIFLFLEFNRFVFASVQAYVAPGGANPQAVIVEGVDNGTVGPDPKLIIPKINVEAPIIYGINPADNNAVENSLRDGVVHYPISNASSNPGEKGATVILGHSSNDVFDDGKYKFVFVQLNKLEEGDTFYVNNNGTRYTYSVTRKEIIEPTDVGKVSADPSKPSIILITCDPPGTALRRLLVFAEQVAPDPEKSEAPKQNEPKENAQNKQIIGNSPTLLERLFGNR
jgi:sortase A